MVLQLTASTTAAGQHGGKKKWRSTESNSTSGRLRVFFPSYHVAGSIWEDSVDVPPEQRSDIEAEIIAAYRDQKRELADKVAARTKQ